ncbi:unnamed protein product [Absidia cylindrospora]
MSAPTVPYVSVEEFHQLRTQNEQLWKIIERQRTMIQNLQKENSHLAAERDGLQDNVNTFERARKQRASILFSPEALRAMTETDEEPSPMPPPRSPYRSNSSKPDQQQQPPQLPQLAHKEHLERQKGKQFNFSLDTSDTTLTAVATMPYQQTPTSPRNLILEKDAQTMQKFKTNTNATTKPPPSVVPVPSVSSPLRLAPLLMNLPFLHHSVLRPHHFCGPTLHPMLQQYVAQIATGLKGKAISSSHHLHSLLIHLLYLLWILAVSITPTLLLLLLLLLLPPISIIHVYLHPQHQHQPHQLLLAYLSNHNHLKAVTPCLQSHHYRRHRHRRSSLLLLQVASPI